MINELVTRVDAAMRLFCLRCCIIQNDKTSTITVDCAGYERHDLFLCKLHGHGASHRISYARLEVFRHENQSADEWVIVAHVFPIMRQNEQFIYDSTTFEGNRKSTITGVIHLLTEEMVKSLGPLNALAIQE